MSNKSHFHRGIHSITDEILDIVHCDLFAITMEPGGSMPHSQGLSNTPYPEPNNPIPRIDTYYFKIYPNIVLPSTPRPS